MTDMTPRGTAMRGAAARGAPVRAVISLLLLLLAATTLLTACGRVGPVRPPGPPDQVTYPRTYPSR